LLSYCRHRGPVEAHKKPDMKEKLMATWSDRGKTGSAAPYAPRPSKCAALREELLSPGLSFLMEAHNGLSAKIVEEAGFRGIWASGLTVSASLGLRDSNEASWTQVLDLVEYMIDATSLPLLLDGDTGYGNFNNVRRLVRKLCERKVAGVCIEDKLFPKTNSFIGERQPLAALACGYRYAALCRSLSGFDAALGEAGPGPALIHVRIQPGSLAKLERPTVRPDEVGRRFRSFLAEEPAR
jgi:Phosphoenolpyruvate phosphomutase